MGGPTVMRHTAGSRRREHRCPGPWRDVEYVGGRPGDHRAGPQARHHRLLRCRRDPRRPHRRRGEHLRPGPPDVRDHAPKSITVHTLREADVADAPPLSDAVAVLRHAAERPRPRRPRGLDRDGPSSPAPSPRTAAQLRSPIIDTAALARADGAAPGSGRGEPDLEWLAGDARTARRSTRTTPWATPSPPARCSSPWPPGSGRLGYRNARDFIDLTAGDRALAER